MPRDPADSNGSKLTRGHKKRERTREQLLASGLAMLSEKGDGLTVSDVVSHANVSNGTFYNYFTDREALLRAVAERSLIEFTRQVIQECGEIDPALRVAIATTQVLNRAQSDPTWGRTILRLTETPLDGASGMGDDLRIELESGFEQGRFDTPPDSITLDLLVGLISLSVRRVTLEDVSDDHIENVVARGLLTLGLQARDALGVSKQAQEWAATCVSSGPTD